MNHAPQNPSAPRLVVGARDWDHRDWRGAYYPDDLPEDWRLAYYASEYTGSLVPAARWMTGSPSLWAAWAADVPAGFRFYLELPAEADRAPLPACAGALGARLGGVLAPAQLEETTAPGLGRWTGGPRILYAVTRPGAPGVEARLWGRPREAPAPEVALIAGDALDDLRGLRRLVEALAAAPADAPGALFLTGEPPDPDRLERLRLLVGLMGLA